MEPGGPRSLLYSFTFFLSFHYFQFRTRFGDSWLRSFSVFYNRKKSTVKHGKLCGIRGIRLASLGEIENANRSKIIKSDARFNVKCVHAFFNFFIDEKSLLSAVNRQVIIDD